MRYTTQFEYKTIVLLFGKEELPKAEEFEAHIKKLFKFLSKTLFTLSSRSACLFMPYFACFSLFRSYIARYAPLKNEKTL